MRWANFFHIYQPPHWPKAVVEKVARESYRPLVRFLLDHRQIRLTLNVSGSLTEQLLARPFGDIVRGLRTLLRRNQIELTDSAMYHAILPLIPEREVVRQIELNRRVNRRCFGSVYRPVGFFPPEMAYSPSLGRLLARRGYRWVILDGLSHSSIVNFETHYRISGTNLSAVFRNRYVSDYLAFAVQPGDVKGFFSTVQRWNGQKSVLVTAMDGENLGHHRHVARRIWQQLVRLPTVETVTISELLRSLNGEVAVTPRSASWSSRPVELDRGTPFALWKNPKNQLHRLQWRLFSIVLKLVEMNERRGRLPPPIRRQFDEVVASDWYWWASREPWWDVQIVVGAAQQLLLLAEELDPSEEVHQNIRALVASIAEVAQRWQSSGAALRHARRHLRGESTPRYLGGKSVS